MKNTFIKMEILVSIICRRGDNAKCKIICLKLSANILQSFFPCGAVAKSNPHIQNYLVVSSLMIGTGCQGNAVKRQK